MKLFAYILLVAASVVMAGNRLSTGSVVFANVQATTEKDSLVSNGDSMVCVIDQIEGSVLSSKMSVTLPDILASGDSCTVWLQELPSPDANKRMETRNWENQGYVADQAAAPHSTGTYVGNSRKIGNFHYGQGAKTFTWSPHDSIVCPRVKIILIDSVGAPIILTGCDSLATSTMRVNKLFAIE